MNRPGKGKFQTVTRFRWSDGWARSVGIALSSEGTWLWANGMSTLWSTKNGSWFQRTQLRRTKSMANKTLPPSPKIFPKPPNFRHEHNHKIWPQMHNHGSLLSKPDSPFPKAKMLVNYMYFATFSAASGPLPKMHYRSFLACFQTLLRETVDEL